MSVEQMIEAARNQLEKERKSLPDDWQDFMVEIVGDLNAALDAARALEAAPKVGEGFVVVPVEPTAEMRAAHAMYGDTSDWWNAVIAAAPTPPTDQQEVKS